METVLLVIHFLALAVGIGGGAASAVAAGIAKSSEPAGAMAIGKVQSKVGDVGFVALIVLWLTGIWMVFSVYGGFSGVPDGFSTKMIGVVGLTIAVAGMQVVKRRAMAAGSPPSANTMEWLGRLALVSAIFTITFAVLTFD